MHINWEKYGEAIKLATTGHPEEGLRILIAIEASANTDVEKATLLLGKSTCFAQLANLNEAFALLSAAKALAVEDRLISSQIALAEANCSELAGKHEHACAQYARVADEYGEILADPQHRDFAQELNARHGYALINAHRPNEAIPLFEELLRDGQYDDLQRVRLFLGVALVMVGRKSNGESQLMAAASGNDKRLSGQAMQHLTALETAVRRS